MEEAKTLQLRLILTHDLLLDPDNQEVRDNVKMYRYSLEPKKLEMIEKEIDAIIEKIVQEANANKIS